MPKPLPVALFLSSLLASLPLGIASAEESTATDPPAATAEKAPTSAGEAAVAAASESPDALLHVERGHRFLAEERYDEAKKEFTSALELKPTVETHVGLATALLRGRRVLQAGELCDPVTFRAELEAHRDEVDTTYDRCRFTCHSPTDPIKDRHYEINSAITQLDLAAKLEPKNVTIYEKLTHAKIALLQFDEEAACRHAKADVRYGTETDFGRITRMDAFELPSLSLRFGDMYSSVDVK